jgi:glucose-6-phosphate 1-dehydrogenase
MITKNQQCFDECTFVILGATGDLAKRRLIPAIYKLVVDKKLCKFRLVGVAFTTTTIDLVLEQAKQFIPNLDPVVWETIEKSSHYYQMDFHNDAAYAGLQELLKRVEKEAELAGNRIFYLATLPDHFEVITKNLAQYNIVESKKRMRERSVWMRVVYEKPFGYDLKSAKRINACIAQVFDDEQVFRIDSWLGKELVSNIALTRFTNRVFEPLWNNQHIESIQVIISETLGVEDRGAFYDSCGALKDMMQNHMLQIVSLVAMEAPEKITADHMSDAKVNVLKKIKITSVIRGQYQGYQDELTVKPHTTTETFAATMLTINNKRWKGVPFYLKTGKNLGKREASVHIKFKMPKCLIDFCPADSNYLTIKIQPNAGLYLELNVKKTGTSDQVVPEKMALSEGEIFGPNTPEAYEVILADVMTGERVTLVRSDEIEWSWKIMQQIEKLKTPVYTYKKGSNGPEELKKLDPKREVRWRA